MDPHFRNLSFRKNLEIQKAFIDEVWGFNYQQVLDFLNTENIPIPDEQSLIAAFNYEKESNPVENISFKNLRYHEFETIINFYKENFESLLKYQKAVFKSDHILLNDSTKLSNSNEMVDFILEKERNNRPNIELPFFKIRAGILSTIRLDNKRKFKKTDFKDFDHASVALPYFDYFFTDKSLRHLLCSKPLCYDKKYDCVVHSSYDNVLDTLRSIKENVH